MRRKTKRIMLAATGGVMFAAQAALGQTISFTGGTYLQNFDSLPTSATAVTPGSLNAADTNPLSITNALPNGLGAGAALSGWYVGKSAGTNANAPFQIHEGSIAAVGSFGSLGALGSTERALGSAATTQYIPRFGAVFVNNSGSTASTLTISFDVEIWRRSDNTNGVPISSSSGTNQLFGYAVGANNITAAVTNVPTLNWGSVMSTQTSNSAVNGNDATNRATRSLTFGLNAPWLSGTPLVLKFDDLNDNGSEDHIGIDNFSMSAVFSVAGKSLVWNGGTAGTWDTSAGNTIWLENATPIAFSNGDSVTFGATPADVAVSVPGAVAPSAIALNHDANTYTFSGAGSIGGAATLTKTNNGNLTIATSNTFIGGSTIRNGVLETRAQGALGTGTINIGSTGTTAATWKVRNAPQTYNNNYTIVGDVLIDTDQEMKLLGNPSGASNTANLIIKNSSGVPLTVTNMANFAGNIRVMEGRLLSGTNAGDLFANTTILTIDQDGIIDFGANGDSIGAVQGSGVLAIGDVTAPGDSFVNFNRAGNFEFSGLITGSGGNGVSMRANGGTQTLSGLSNFVSATDVQAGTLIVKGDVRTNEDGPLGNSGLTITVGAPDNSANSAQFLVGSASEIGRPILIRASTGAGTVTIGGNTDATSIFSGDITLDKRVFITSQATGTNAVRITGSIISGAVEHGITKTGPGIVELGSAGNSFTGVTNVNQGTLRVTGSIALSNTINVNTGGVFEVANTQTVQTLVVNSGGTVRMTDEPGGPARVLTLSRLTLNGGTASGAFDVGKNGVIIDYAAGNSPIAAIKTALATGTNLANGIFTSQSTNNASLYAVGYVEASEISATSWLGQPVNDDSALLMRYTLRGDLNLDGAVTFADLLRVAANFGTMAGTADWTDGDINYDSSISFADLLAVAANFGGVAASSVDMSGLSSDQQAALGAAMAAVPEPGSLALVGLGAAAMLGRRRRH